MTTTLEQRYSIHIFFWNCPLPTFIHPSFLVKSCGLWGRNPTGPDIQLYQLFSFCLRCWIYGWSQIEHWCHCMCSSWITNCHQAEHLHPWGRKRSKLSCSDFMQHHCKNKNLSILPACYFLHNGNFIMQGMSITVKKLSQKTRHEYKTWSTDLFA